jgi:simple sugar transport system ATP-binding protein
VHCLLGDNGAGKSTLIKTLAACIAPTRAIPRRRPPVHFKSPREALDVGIATVYQDLALVPLMSVARNSSWPRAAAQARRPLPVMDHALARRTAIREARRDGHQGARRQPGRRHDERRRAQCLAIARAITSGRAC